jgi:cytochrome oxidase assembly protein ShyY1
MRRKNNAGVIFSFLFLFVLVVMLVLGHWQLRRQEKRVNELQTVVIQNSQATTAIVNYINSSLASFE